MDCTPLARSTPRPRDTHEASITLTAAILAFETRGGRPLSGSLQRAWSWLRQRTDRPLPDEFDFRLIDLGRDLKASSTSTPHRWIDRLAAEGLLTVVSRRTGRRGFLTVRLHDPRCVGELRLETGDPQLTLGIEDQPDTLVMYPSNVATKKPEPSTEENEKLRVRVLKTEDSMSQREASGCPTQFEPKDAQRPSRQTLQTPKSHQPAAVSRLGPHAHAHATMAIESTCKSPSPLSVTSPSSDVTPTGSARRPLPARDDESPGPARINIEIKDRMAQLLATTPGDPEKHAAAEKLARWISQQVTDPKLQITTCRRIARAIVFGTQGAYLPQDELDDALQSLAEKRRRLAAHGTTFDKGPGAYFVASMKRAFARHGVQWTKSHDSAISGGRR